MYRDYENPRELEKQLQDLRKQLADVQRRKLNLVGVGNVNDYGYSTYDMLSDAEIALMDSIVELEQRVNFAWQDEEFG